MRNGAEIAVAKFFLIFEHVSKQIQLIEGKAKVVGRIVVELGKQGCVDYIFGTQADCLAWKFSKAHFWITQAILDIRYLAVSDF